PDLATPIHVSSLDRRPHGAFEQGLLVALIHLRRHHQAASRSSRDLDRFDDALLRRDSADEQEVLAWDITDGRSREVQSVMDRRDPVRVLVPPPLTLADRNQ